MLEVKGPGGGTHLVVVGGGYPGGGAGLQQGQGAGQCPRQRHGGGAALSSGVGEFPARLFVRLARLLSLMTTRNEPQTTSSSSNVTALSAGNSSCRGLGLGLWAEGPKVTVRE